MIYAITLILLVLSPAPEAAGLTCDARLTLLFTPSPAREGRYEACVSPLGLSESRVEGLKYGQIEALEALDAFGRVGQYDRAKLARLYGGRRAMVLHGWRRDGDRVESVTLISPHPDASLTRLNEGTLVIVWKSEVGSLKSARFDRWGDSNNPAGE